MTKDNLLRRIEELYGEIIAISLPALEEVGSQIILEEGLYTLEGFSSKDKKAVSKPFSEIKRLLKNYFEDIDVTKIYIPFTLWTWDYCVWSTLTEDDVMTFNAVSRYPKHLY